MTRAELHRLIDELPDDAVEGAGVFLSAALHNDYDPDQTWVWTARWQSQLRESLADLQEGRSLRFESAHDFLKAL